MKKMRNGASVCEKVDQKNAGKRGMATVEIIALTVVVVGAVIGVATILSPGLQTLFTNLLAKVTTMIGL